MSLNPAAPVDVTQRVWFTAAQAAEYLGYRDGKTIRRAHLDGRIRGVRSAPTTRGSRGGNLRFRRDWLDRFAAGLPPEADAQPAPTTRRRTVS